MGKNKTGSVRRSRSKRPSKSEPVANPLRSEAEARFADITALSVDWIWETDAAGRYVYSSVRVFDILGYSPDEVVGKTLFDLMVPAEADRLRDVWGEAIAALRPIEDFVHQKVAKDGRKVRLQTQAVPVFAADGGLLGYRGIDRDVAAQEPAKDAQQQLREQETFLRHVLDINPNLVFVRDREGRFILANQALADAYNTTVENLIGKTDADFGLSEADVATIRSGDLEVMESQEDKFIPESLISYGGTRARWVQTIKRPLVDEDGVARRVLGVSSDITERKLMQQGIEASLERRGRQVQTSTEIAQEIAGVTALDELFHRVVTLIKERFGYYHAQIFRYDAASEAMRLVVGYGKTGQAMLEANHHLPMGRGVVGTASATGQPVLASDVEQDPDWIPNEFLPKTRGELAVPIKLRDKILGILDVQSEVAGALTEEDQLLLEGLCGQIAIAIESTQSERRYRVLFEQASDAIFLEDEDQQIVDVNQRTCEMFGYTRDALLSMKTADLQPASSGVGLPIYEDPSRGVYELKAARQDGTPIYIEVHITPLDLGEQRLFLSVVQDITERKTTEMALARERALSQSLMESTPDHIYFKDLEGRFFRINQAMADWLGLDSPADAIGKTDFDFFSEEHARKAYEDEQVLMQTQRALIGMEEKETWPDGRVTWVSTTKIPLFDTHGALQGSFGVSRDITESRLAQEQLREIQHLLQGILDNTTVVIYIKDLQGRYLLVNRRYETLFGVKMADIIGKTFQEIFPDLSVGGFGAGDRAVLEDGKPQEKIESLQQDDGEHTYLSLKFPLSEDDGSLYAIGCISTDITEREAAEEERVRLVSDLESHAAQLETALEDTAALYRAGQAINIATTPEEVVFALVVGLRLSELRRITLNLFDRPWSQEEKPEHVETIAIWDERVEEGVAPPIATGRRFDLSKYPAAELFTPEVPLVFTDITTDPRVDPFSRALFRDVFETRCTIFLPMVTRGQCIGFVNVFMRTETEFDSSHLRRLTALASQAATAVQNMRLLESAQGRARRERALREVTAAIGPGEDIDGFLDALPQIVSPLRQLVPLDLLALAVYTPGEKEFELFAILTGLGVEHFAHQGMRMPLAGNPVGWVIVNAEPYLDADIRENPAFAQDRQLIEVGLRSRLLLPMRFGGQVVGALSMGSRTVAAFSPDDLPILQRVADHLAQALDRTRLLETTRLARDEVAAVHRSYLRQGWEEYLEKEQMLSQSAFVYDHGQVEVRADFSPVEMLRTLETGDMVMQGMDVASSEEVRRTALSVPIEVRGQVLGVLGFEDPTGEWRWTADQLTLIQAVAQQLGQVLENARLIEATQNQAERERLVDEVSSRVRASLELDTVLRTAIAELRDALQLTEVEVRIGPEPASQESHV